MERSLYVHSKGKVSNFCKKSTKKFFILNTRCCQWYWKPDIEENWPNLGWVKFFSWQAQILWNTFQKVIFNCFTFFYFLRQLDKLFYQLLPNWFEWVQFFANRLFAVLPLLLLSFEGQFHLDLFQKVFSTFLQSWFHRLQKCSWYSHFTSLWEVFKWRKRILSFEKFRDETDDIAQ